MPVVDVVRDAKPVPTAPVDTSVIIPDAVKRAAAHADAFYSANPPAPEPQSIPFDVQPTVMKPAEPAAPTPQPEPQAATPAPQPESTPAPQPVEHSENDVKAMAGRLKKQQQTIKDLQTQMSAMGDELLAAQRHLRTPPLQPDPEPQPLLSEQELRDYGPDFINVVKRAAREEFLPEVNTLRQENERVKRQAAEQAMRGVYAYLDQNVENWRIVNHSAPFKSWLRLRDSLSGSIRQELLDTAFQSADALRVAAFFKGFLSEEAASSPAPRETPQLQQVPARQPAIALETLAAPGRARSAPSNPPAEKPTYTRREIAKFYEDVRKGLWAGRETMKSQIEADIFAAQSDGRIRG
jgi:hypothetical protein